MQYEDFFKLGERKWKPTSVAPKPARGFTGQISRHGITDERTVGGSRYTRGDDGTWTKTLDRESQERYRTSRPDMYKTLNQQGQYTENWQNTVFIDPQHASNISYLIQRGIPVAVPTTSGFEYHAMHLLDRVPSSMHADRQVAGAPKGFGLIKIPAEHISSEPFPGTLPFQHGRVTLADGSARDDKQHMGNSVGSIDY